ncbi:hypothetical protein ACFQS3_02420 [Glycomyces mayteni]|uniref:Uncharacterized protein n=1 Tax=Glycomyces mayteni TaxID=543887 RepID=A0ABW2D3G0_9ACTN|nr:hypothetical protein GCM10025732_47830 [Glycomyces mayteni]
MSYNTQSGPFDNNDVPPWADEPEAPVQEGQPAWADPAVTSPEAVSATLKAGRDFDAPWVVVKGPTADSVSSHLDDVIRSGLLAKTADAGRQLQSAWGAQAPTPQAQAPRQNNRPASNGWGGPRPQNPAPQGGGNARTKGAPIPTGQACAHGVLAYTSWTAKDGSGRTFEAYKCPAAVADYRDPNSCKETVWADKVR